MNEFFRLIRILIPVVLACCGLLGCSKDAPSAPHAPKADSVGSAPYALKALVEQGGKRRVVKIGPMDDVASLSKVSPGAPRHPADASRKPELRPQATVGTPDGGAVDTNVQDQTNQVEPGSTLLFWAVASCTQEAGSPFNTNYLVPLTGVGSTDYVFAEIPTSCDESLFYQAMIVCAANRLAQIGDGVGTVSWNTRQPGRPDSSSDAGTDIRVTLPPQASEDQFIARDIATSALAHLAFQQLITPAPYFNAWTGDVRLCVDAYAHMAKDGTIPQFPGTSVSVPALPDPIAYFAPKEGFSTSGLDSAAIQEIGRARLRQQATITAAAAGLLRELTTRSIEADLAGAEKLKASAGDPTQGLRLFWGDPAANESPYNSMRHAMRVLFGRLEMGIPHDRSQPDDWTPLQSLGEGRGDAMADPRCFRDQETGALLNGFITPQQPFGGGVGELDLITALDGGFAARWANVPPTTRTQALLMSSFERAGLVLPDFSSSFPEPTPPQTFKDAVKATLNREAARSAGVPYDTFKTSTQALAANSLIDQSDDADIRFALDRVYDEFRLITEIVPQFPEGLGDPIFDFGTETAGLVKFSVPEVEALSGIVIDGGLPMTKVREDVIARLGYAARSSQCGHDSRYESDFLGAPAFDYTSGRVTAFQNTFSLGEVMRRQLGVLRDRAREASAADVAELADIAMSEGRDWAGGRAIRFVGADDNLLHVQLVELSPDDLGTATLDDAAATLVLVPASNGVGPKPLFADCAAGVRTSCPSDIQILSPTSHNIVTSAPGGVKTGLNLPVLELTYQPTDAAAFDGYLVQIPSAKVRGGTGRVLAFLSQTTAASDTGISLNRYTSEVISPAQRRLADRIFGLGNAEARQTCASVISTALPQDYCALGMQRDMFVPLEDELTTSGASATSGTEESWQHYLTVAQQAAASADDLGRQLIETGLQRDLRAEAATEDVGNLCGTYPNVQKIDSQTGELGPTTDNQAINSCVADTTVDIVFLRDDPYVKCAQNPPAPGSKCFVGDPTQDIKDHFCPTGSDPKPPFCNKTVITHAGLGFVTNIPPIPDETAVDICGQFANTYPPREGAQHAPASMDPEIMAGFISQSDQKWSKREGLKAALQNIKVTQYFDGEWIVTFGNRPGPSGLNLDDAAGKPPIATYNGLLRAVYPNGAPAVATDQFKALAADVWPACKNAAGCSARAKIVANFFTDVTDPDDEWKQRQLLEIESAIFYMGAMIGTEIPAGTFSIPVPVANFTGAANNTTFSAPAYYAPSEFTETSPGSLMFKMNGNNFRAHGISVDAPKNDWQAADDISAQGPLAKLQPGIALRPSKADHPALQWQTDISNTAARYLQVQAESAAVPFSTNGGRQDLGDIAKFALTLNSIKSAADACSNIKTSTTADAQAPNVRTWLGGGYTPATVISSLVDPPNLTGPLPPGRHSCVTLPLLMNEVTSQIRTNMPIFFGDGAGVSDRINFAQTLQSSQIYPQLGNVLGQSWSSTDCGGLSLNPRCKVQWELFAPQECPSLQAWQVAAPNTSPCMELDLRSLSNSQPAHQILAVAHDRLRASVCAPSNRVEMFLDHNLKDDCEGLAVATRALALSCLYDVPPPLTTQITPPPIDSPLSLAVFEQWLARTGRRIDSALNGMYIVDVPSEVVNNAKSDKVDIGAAGQGQRGKLVLELGKNLRNIENGFANIGTEFGKLQGEVRKVRVDIQYTDMDAEKQQVNLAFQKLEINRQIAVADAQRTREQLATASNVLRMGIGVVAPAPGLEPLSAKVLAPAFASAATSIFDDLLGKDEHDDNQEALTQELTNVVTQGKIARTEADNRIDASLAALSENVLVVYQAINDHLTEVTNGQATALEDINDLKGNSASARIALAKAKGADLVIDAANQEVLPLPVNTVYRRQFSILEQRYGLALNNAKRAAYLARLAIEQRLGVRLRDLVQGIGPIEAPALWADQLCSLQGIDYNALRQNSVSAAAVQAAADAGQTSVTSADTSQEIDLIKGFADQFIGDYVARLKEFVEFYNIAYPFRDADDTAILSLREDLRNSRAQCTVTSKNVLFHSQELDSFASELTDSGQSKEGWTVSPCDDTACLSVTGPMALRGGADGTVALLPPSGVGRATWLQSKPLTVFDAGPPDDGGAVPEGGSPFVRPALPSGYLYQTVTLDAGQRYTLSWWDMARSADGTPYVGAGAPPQYRITVATADWQPLAFERIVPATGGADGTVWSDRHEVTFIAPDAGAYQIGFSAADPGIVGASLAIADVQLEPVQGAAPGATTYEATSGSRLVVSTGCPVDDTTAFRDRFEYRCDSDGCFYELRDLILIDSEVLNQGLSSLVGKVGTGNYNYRHSTTAVNLVGTGILDCSVTPRQSCNSSGYVEYDLVHTAFNAPLINGAGETHCFNFGQGAIRSGKALATERVLTLPLGSADRDLISQSAFLKPELVGRPLGGAYRLRIKATPQLVWSRVQDIQILLNYRYWSRVQTGSAPAEPPHG